MAMVQLASAGVMSSLLPMPLFAGTLGAVFTDTHHLGISRNTASSGVFDYQGVTGLPRTLASSTGSSSSSITAHLLNDPPAITGIYADLYLYVQSACCLVMLQSGLLLASSMAVIAFVEVFLVRAYMWWLELTSMFCTVIIEETATKGLFWFVTQPWPSMGRSVLNPQAVAVKHGSAAA
jgi:hypothetical protein